MAHLSSRISLLVLIGVIFIGTVSCTSKVDLNQESSIVGVRGISYDSFLGIPYALPPEGNLRFRDPQPAPLWNGTYRALVPRLYCWQFKSQIFPFPTSGSEDCLYLDIYRPRVATKKPLNVIVHIHGGGFYGGIPSSLIYGPDYFMDTEEVVLVNIAYRLNVFGFLATGDSASPGNYGLKDQEMALRWIKTHIGAFGGDPNKITILGQSAGGTSVNYHLLNKRSEGLFKNAVMFSGTVEAPWANLMQNPRETVNEHANVLGIENAQDLDSETLVERLRQIPARELVKSLLDLFKWENLPCSAYRPVIEPAGTPNAFISSDPREAMENGDFVKVPILSSLVAGDGINLVQPLLADKKKNKEFNDDIYRILPIVLEMDPNHPNMTEIVDLIRAEYLGPNGFADSESLNAMKMATQYFYERPFYTSLSAMAQYTPVYTHSFLYQGMSSMSFHFTGSVRDFGVVHTDDILYLFRSSGLFPIQLSIKDKKFQSLYMDYILNFVKNDDTGYKAWDLENPEMARFGGLEDYLAVDYVPVRKHEFWGMIEEMYN